MYCPKLTEMSCVAAKNIVGHAAMTTVLLPSASQRITLFWPQTSTGISRILHGDEDVHKCWVTDMHPAYDLILPSYVVEA